MIKTYLILFITILLTSQAYTQNFWEYLGLNGFRVGYITEDNTGRLYASEDLGSGDSVYFSDDGGVNWQSYGEVNDSFYINISSMVALNNNDIILSAWAIQGGGIYKSTDGSFTWLPKNTGLNENDVDKIIRSSDSIYAGANDGVYLSTDDAETWTKLNTEPDTILYVQSIAKSSDGKLFAIDFDNAFRSTDNGVTWDTINNGINASQLNSLIISSGKYLLLGAESIGIYKSTDWGDNWELKELVSARTMTTNSSGYIMASAVIDGLLLSTDDGENWEQINSGLPSSAIVSIYFDKEGYAYCGVAHFGIYKSTFPVTSVDEVIDIQPKEFKLFQNYPNPFNPSTTIKYSIPFTGTRDRVFVQLIVYDILGKKVATLVNEEKPAGTYEVEFNAEKLPSGIYFYKLRINEYFDVKKMLMIK